MTLRRPERAQLSLKQCLERVSCGRLSVDEALETISSIILVQQPPDRDRPILGPQQQRRRRSRETILCEEIARDPADSIRRVEDAAELEQIMGEACLIREERECLVLLAEGYSETEIAQRFECSDRTVRRRRRSAVEKLKAAWPDHPRVQRMSAKLATADG
ncbi:MAG: LuxR C-terminal-related transcriptional regulator [Armatimonadota bacterium]